MSAGVFLIITIDNTLGHWLSRHPGRFGVLHCSAMQCEFPGQITSFCIDFTALGWKLSPSIARIRFCFSTSSTTSDGNGGLMSRMKIMSNSNHLKTPTNSSTLKRFPTSQDPHKWRVHTSSLLGENQHVIFKCIKIFGEIYAGGPSLCRCRPSCAESSPKPCPIRRAFKIRFSGAPAQMLKKHISGHFSVGTVHISNKMYTCGWGQKWSTLGTTKVLMGEITENISAWCIASASVFFCNINLCARSNGGLHAGSPRIALVFSNKSRYAFTPFSYRDIQRIQHVFQGKSNKANPYNYWLYIWLYVQYVHIHECYIYILYRESFKMPGFIFGKDHPLNTGLLTRGMKLLARSGCCDLLLSLDLKRWHTAESESWCWRSSDFECTLWLCQNSYWKWP